MSMRLKIKIKDSVSIESVKDINDKIKCSGIEIIDQYSEHVTQGKRK